MMKFKKHDDVETIERCIKILKKDFKWFRDNNGYLGQNKNRGLWKTLDAAATAAGFDQCLTALQEELKKLKELKKCR